MDDAQRDEVDEQRARVERPEVEPVRGRAGIDRPRNRWAAPSDAEPTTIATATKASRVSSVGRGRGRIRTGAARAPGRRRSFAAPVEAEPDLAHLELVAEPERRDALDRARR